MNLIKRLFRSVFATATVDGITFYSGNAFLNYLKEKERKALGLHKYCVPCICLSERRLVINMLESKGIFDYTDGKRNEIIYYADHQIIKITTTN